MLLLHLCCLHLYSLTNLQCEKYTQKTLQYSSDLQDRGFKYKIKKRVLHLRFQISIRGNISADSGEARYQDIFYSTRGCHGEHLEPYLC